MINTHKHSNCIIFFVPLLATFLINVELTAFNLAIAQIAKSFSIPLSSTSNLFSIYLAFFAVFTMVGGKFGDMWGRLSIIYWMLGLFIIASLLGGYAENYWELLISRALQGLSAGAMLPNVTALLYLYSIPQKKHQVIGLMSAVVGFSTALGPILGSLITSHLGWRYIFFFNIPFACIIVFGFLLFFKNVKNNYLPNKLDYKGMLLTIVLILALMKFIELMHTLNHQEIILSVFALSFLLAGWLFIHLKFENPFLTLNLFKVQTYLVGCTIRMFLGVVYYAILFILGVFAQEVLHLKSSVSGLIYLPLTLSVTFASLFYQRLTENFNIVTLLRAGLLIFCCGIILLLTHLNSALWVTTALTILGGSYGILYSTLFSITLYKLDEAKMSEASGSLYFFNLLGGTIGVSLVGFLFTTTTTVSIAQNIICAVHNMLIYCALIIFACFISSFMSLKRLPAQNT